MGSLLSENAYASEDLEEGPYSEDQTECEYRYVEWTKIKLESRGFCFGDFQYNRIYHSEGTGSKLTGSKLERERDGKRGEGTDWSGLS